MGILWYLANALLTENKTTKIIQGSAKPDSLLFQNGVPPLLFLLPSTSLRMSAKFFIVSLKLIPNK